MPMPVPDLDQVAAADPAVKAALMVAEATRVLADDHGAAATGMCACGQQLPCPIASNVRALQACWLDRYRDTQPPRTARTRGLRVALAAAA